MKVYEQGCPSSLPSLAEAHQQPVTEHMNTGSQRRSKREMRWWRGKEDEEHWHSKCLREDAREWWELDDRS